MVIALQRSRKSGIERLAPFAGTHVGVNAPLIDRTRMALLSEAERRMIWARIRETLGADVIAFGRVLETDAASFPDTTCVASDSLYRTEFADWESCDREQRSRSRRKHDKQQGQKLAAMGEVTYEEIGA